MLDITSSTAFDIIARQDCFRCHRLAMWSHDRVCDESLLIIGEVCNLEAWNFLSIFNLSFHKAVFSVT